jgi:hypothetical protein
MDWFFGLVLAHPDTFLYVFSKKPSTCLWDEGRCLHGSEASQTLWIVCYFNPNLELMDTFLAAIPKGESAGRGSRCAVQTSTAGLPSFYFNTPK